MGVRPAMFKAGRSRRPATVPSASSYMNGEIDLREEFDKIMYGPDGDGEGRHGHPCLIRRVRRDSSGYPVKCTCAVASPNGQGNPDCNYCLAEGYLWDEEWAITFSMYVGPDGGKANRYIRMQPGSIKTDYLLFFLRYDLDIKYNDKIIEIVLDEEGEVVLNANNTFIRETIYKPETIVKYRSDNGRIEYLAVYCREEDSIRNDNPV
jgi:hypothetical protein